MISPVLANIYLHFVQDLWIKKVVTKHSKGRVLFRRYADDSVVCFERKEDAEAYLRALPERLAKFGLRTGRGKERAGEIQPVGSRRPAGSSPSSASTSTGGEPGAIPSTGS